MSRIVDKAAELLEEAFAVASDRRWQQIKATQCELTRLQLLSEEDAATNAKRKVLTIITKEDQDG